MTDTGLPSDAGRAVGRAAVFAACYLAAAEAGRLFTFPNAPFAAFWPPSGLTLGALLLAPRRSWWALLVGSLAAHLASDGFLHPRPLGMGVATWAGNALEALTGVLLLDLTGFQTGPLRRFKDVGRLFAVTTLAGAPLGATIGTIVHAAYGGNDPGSSWHMRWSSNLLGVLIVTPMLLAWSDTIRILGTRAELLRALETGTALAALVAVGHLIFGEVVRDHSPLLQFPYLLFPFLIWSGFRLGPRWAATAVLLVTGGVAYHTAHGQGPFDALTDVLYDRVVLLQTFLGVAAFVSLTLSSEVSERSDLADALRASEGRLRDLFENAHDLIQIVAPDGRLLYVNPAWRETLGYAPSEIADLTLFDVLHPESEADCRDAIRRLVAGESVGQMEVAFMSRDTGPVAVEGTCSCRLEGGRAASIRGIFRDVTERKRAERELAEQRRLLVEANARLAELATTDPLTGLANRRAFEDALAREAALAARDGRPLSLAVLDVDQFKQFNDDHGHPAGDDVLRRIAALLRAATRGSDLPARMGGEEFAVLLAGTADGGARDAAERIRRAVEGEPWELRRVTVSVGVATFQAEAGEAAERQLLEVADRALYRAKRGGRNCVESGAGDADVPPSTVALRAP